MRCALAALGGRRSYRPDAGGAPPGHGNGPLVDVVAEEMDDLDGVEVARVRAGDSREEGLHFPRRDAAAESEFGEAPEARTGARVAEGGGD